MQKIITDKKTGKTRVYTENREPSLTQQQFAEEADVNYILKKYHANNLANVPAPAGMHQPIFADFTNVQDFHSTLNLINEAETEFQKLPSHIRKRFNNDPGQVFEFLSDSNNKTEAITLGLIPTPSNPPLSPTLTPTPTPTSTPSPKS